MKTLAIVALIFAGMAGSLRADAITYNFTGNGGAFDFQSKTGSITTNGITMTFEAFALVGGELDPGAELNAASGSFGVNNGISGDNTSRLNVDQWITITFNVFDPSITSINLQTVTLGTITSGFSGYYQIDDGSQVAIASKGDYVVNPVVDVIGKTLTVAITAGATDTTSNGAIFQGITVDAVPEPAVMGLLGFGGLLTLLVRRRFFA